MKENEKKKNVLDLQFQKYLIIASTSIIIAFTYSVGIVIAILTEQINFNNYLISSVLFLISAIVFSLCFRELCINDICEANRSKVLLREREKRSFSKFSTVTAGPRIY